MTRIITSALRRRRRRRRRRTLALLATLAAASAIGAARAQSGAAPIAESAVTHRAEQAELPFAPGERLTYAISYGRLHVGSGSMELSVGDSVRGHPTLHGVFLLHAGALLFKVNDRIESWFDASPLMSLRFAQQLSEGRYHASRRYELFPDRATVQQEGDTARPSVSEPLDDVSFLYFVRTLPLEVGQRYEFHRYFQLSGNPIVITVLRRERITVPAGTFDAVVVRPEITTSGMFAKGGRAEVWIRADGAHEVLQMRSHLAIGSLDLYLTGRDSSSAVAP